MPWVSLGSARRERRMTDESAVTHRGKIYAEDKTCDSAQMDIEDKRFSPRQTYNWTAHPYLPIFYLFAVFTAICRTLTVRSAISLKEGRRACNKHGR